MSTTDNNTNQEVQGVDDLSKQILEKQSQELSYMTEATQASEERTKYLAKKNSYTIAFDNGTKQTFPRKGLSNKKSREIDELRTAFATITHIDPEKPLKIQNYTFTTIGDVVYTAFQKTLEYCLGLTPEQFDDNYEKLGPIVQGHILRINTELSPEIDFNKIRKQASDSKLSNTNQTVK